MNTVGPHDLSRPVQDSSPIKDNMLRDDVVLFTILTIHSAVAADPQVNILLLFSKAVINQTEK